MIRKVISSFHRRTPAKAAQSILFQRFQYHSYPDPSDVGVVTKARSEAAKQLVKGKEFDLDPKFLVDKVFPGVFAPTEHISPANAPKTISTVLENGLTVVSQDMPSLMSSFTLLVKSGR